MDGENRESGISVIGSVPWGSHLCALYATRKDLFEIITLYFNAGLKNNEFCVLVANEFCHVNGDTAADYPEIAGFAPYLQTGQMEIVPHAEQYVEFGKYDNQESLAHLLQQVDMATEKGYEGVRIAGEIAWAGNESWRDTIWHRIKIKRELTGVHILGLSTYPLKEFMVTDLLIATKTLKYIFINRNGRMSLIENSILRQPPEITMQREAQYSSVIEGLKKKSDEEQKYLDNAAVILLEVDAEGKVTHINPKGCEILGYTRDEIIGKNWFDDFVPPRIKKSLLTISRKLLSGETRKVDYYENPVLTRSGEERLIAWHNTVIRDDLGNITSHYSAGMDITQHKREKESRKKLLRPMGNGRLTPAQEKYINTGLQGFNDQEIMELFFSLNLPSDIANRLARTCIEKYHNLREFLAAPVENLQRLGIPRSCIFSLKLIHELPVHVLKEEIMKQPAYCSPQDIFNYLYYSMRDLKNEVSKVIYLNVKNQIIDIHDGSRGTMEKIAINAREVIESAIEHEAKALVFIHNHPSGDPTPSPADKKLTRDLVFVGNILQIKVLDHLIIGDNTYYSFAGEGLIKEYELDFLNLRLSGTSEAKKRLSEAQLSIGI